MMHTSMVRSLCCLAIASGMLAQEPAWAKRRADTPYQAPDYAALAMADHIASDRLRPLGQGQTAAPAPMASTEPSSEVTSAWAEDLEKLPVTAAGRMSATLVIKPSTKAQDKGSGGARTVSDMSPAVAVEGEPRFDLSISNAPATQVFLQLGTGTSYNVLVSPEVSGMISVQLKNITVPEALEALRDLYGYDFRITGKRVMVYPNSVQTRVFKINYLPGRRQGMSDLRVSGNSVADAGGNDGSSGGRSGNNSRSTTEGHSNNSAQVKTTSDADFWREIKDSLTSMMPTEGGRSVVINPSAGVIVVRATPSEQRAVGEFLKTVQLTVERQVMLEAKIIEVTLSNDSQTGVNWAHFRGKAGDNLVTTGNVAPGVTLSNGIIRTASNTIDPATGITTDSAGRGFYGLAIQSSNFMALINFLETQGDVQVLSSPRIATINNQKAILKVGSDEFFVTGLKTEVTAGSNGGDRIVSPTITVQPFFSGIALDVTPQIDDAGSVILHVHPAVSAVSTKDKLVNLGDLGTFKLPLAASSINETDSIVRVQDGQIVAIGGLMSEATSKDKQGVKGLNRIPVVGQFLFGQKTEVSSKRELVILIKPTVIGEDGAGWSNGDTRTSALSLPR